MYREFDEAQILPLLDAAYEAAISPGGWRPVLERLSALFNCHFADLFARTHDWTRYRGIAIGLDRADYEDEFLGAWCNRNVWSKAKPVRAAGEVLATWQMVPKAAVLRSEIYAGYLKPRALNEGLRLSLWADEYWIQDISLIRPWAAGPFTAGEIALGRFLLPHLQRAASLSRRLGGLNGPLPGLATLDALGRPAFLLDEFGRLIQLNAAAEPLLAAPGGLLLHTGYLAAAAPADQPMFTAAIAAAAGTDRSPPRANAMRLSLAGNQAPICLDFVPLHDHAPWSLPGPRAVLLLATMPTTADAPTKNGLIARYGLTRAEAELALALLAGRSLAQVAATTGRSVHTIRSHAARVLAKTHTRRQGELIRLLSGHDPTGHESPVTQMIR